MRTALQLRFLAGVFNLHFLYYFFCLFIYHIAIWPKPLDPFCPGKKHIYLHNLTFPWVKFLRNFCVVSKDDILPFLSFPKKSNFFRQVALGSRCFVFVYLWKDRQHNIPATNIMLKQSVKHRTLPKETQRPGVGCLNRINDSCNL